MTGVVLSHALAACGIPALAYVLGARAVRNADELSSLPVARAIVAFAVGAALLTPALVLLAVIGWLHLPMLGVAAWLIVAIELIQKLSSGLTGTPPTWAEITIVVAAGIFAVVAGASHDETLGAGRDQQVYAEFAIALANHGTPRIRYSPVDSADRTLLRTGYSQSACRARFIDRWSRKPLNRTPFVVPGGTNACNGVDNPITLLHPWGWPVWLAIAYEIAGVAGVFSANAIVFAVGVVLFFALLRLLVGGPPAALATAALLLLPCSLWIAGISLSEPLAMTFMLTALVLASIGPARYAWLAGAASLAAIVVRIDSAVLVPAAIAAAMAAATAPEARDPGSTGTLRRFALGQLVALIAAGGIYVFVFPSYLDVFWTRFLAVLAFSTVLALAVCVLNPRSAAWLGRFLRSATCRGGLAGGVVLLVLYAAVVRPELRESADLRQLSMLNLAANVSWPVLLAAIGGVVMAIWQGWASRAAIRYPLVLVLVLGTSVELLAFPGVSPDQPWGFRRFLPVVVPCSLLFAALLVQALRRSGRRWISHGVFVLVSATLVASIALLPRGGAMLRENDGYLTQIDSIAKALPTRLTLATAAQGDVASTLLVAYGEPVATSDGGLMANDDDVPIARWIADRLAEGHPATVLHGPELRESGLELTNEHRWTLRRNFVVPQTRAPATTIGAESRIVTLSRIDGFDQSFATRMFGAERAWGSEEGGFLQTEVSAYGALRYTDGNAWIDIPSEALRGRDAVKVDLLSPAREATHHRVSIMLNGRVAWKGNVPAGISTIRVPIAEPTAGRSARIGIASELVDVGDGAAGAQRRRVGVGVLGIRPLYPGEPHESGSSMTAFKAALVPLGSVPDPIVMGRGAAVTLAIRNLGSAYWPSYREHADPRGVVKIALQWFERGTDGKLVSEGRWPMAISLLDGDRTRVRVPIEPSQVGARPLAAGSYVLRIRMVREGYALFPESASGDLSFDIRVTSDPAT